MVSGSIRRRAPAGRGSKAAPFARPVAAALLAAAAWSLVPADPAPAGAPVGPGVSAAPSPGCRGATGAPTPTREVPISAGGRTGFYFIEVPTSARAQVPTPLVVDLHGYFETAQIQVDISGLGAYGQAHGFITVTPQVDEKVPYWESVIGSPDMAFFSGLLSHVEGTACIDENRVFVTGYSNGAFMTSAIACQFAGRVAAVAPVAGVEDPGGCRPSRPVPLLAIHGTADPLVHFDGTPSKEAANLPAPSGDGKTLGDEEPSLVSTGGPSIPEVTAAWAQREHCAAGPTRVRVASDVTLVRYRCPHHAEVELYVVAGGGHAWPGSRGSADIASVIGRTTFSISADAVMWRFFEAHPLARAD